MIDLVLFKASSLNVDVRPVEFVLVTVSNADDTSVAP